MKSKTCRKITPTYRINFITIYLSLVTNYYLIIHFISVYLDSYSTRVEGYHNHQFRNHSASLPIYLLGTEVNKYLLTDTQNAVNERSHEFSHIDFRLYKYQKFAKSLIAPSQSFSLH